MLQFDLLYIFQMGWNHKLVSFWPTKPMIFNLQAGDVVRAGICGMSESHISFEVGEDIE